MSNRVLSEPMESLDPGIPALQAVLDPEELGRHLRLISSPAWPWGNWDEVRVHRLKSHSGSRCTLEIALRINGGWHPLIGKVYTTDRSDVFRAMEGIRQAGFGPGEEFSIPQPLAFLPSLCLLLQEKVEGPRAQEIFRTGNQQQRTNAAARCARWLARFHARAPKSAPIFDRDNHSGLMRRWGCQIAELGDPCAPKAARLLKRLEHLATGLDRIEACAGHGSYSPAQVILAEGRTVAFDWDGYDLADPGRDVARFIIALRRLALGRLRSIRALDAACEVFEKAYLASGRAEAQSTLRFYKGALCLQLAHYNLLHQVPRWREKVEAMLDEGLRVLEV